MYTIKKSSAQKSC